MGKWCGTGSTKYKIVNQLKYGAKSLDFLSLTYFSGLIARCIKFALFSSDCKDGKCSYKPFIFPMREKSSVVSLQYPFSGNDESSGTLN